MITINLESTVPLEEQIAREIRGALARGQIAPGDPLPSVRQLAGDLGIHWNTVARAYRRLRDEDLLAVGRGRGVFVRAQESRQEPARPETRNRIRGLLRDAVTEARLAGVDLDCFKGMVSSELQFWENGG